MNPQLKNQIAASAIRMRSLANRLAQGGLSIPEWQDRMGEEIYSIHTMAAVAAAPDDAIDTDILSSRIDQELGSLAFFTNDIQANLQPLDHTLLRRVEMYADDARDTYVNFGGPGSGEAEQMAVVAAYRKAKASFAQLEARHGRKAAVAMAGAYLSCYATYAANPSLAQRLPGSIAAILGTTEALRALSKGAGKEEGAVAFKDDLEESVDQEALAQDIRLGQAAERVEQALEAQQTAPDGLTTWTQEDLNAARAALREARQAASLVDFSLDEEADQDELGLSVEAQIWFEAVEDGRVVLPDVTFAYDEQKHPRGRGGKWTSKPGAAEAVAAHQTAEKDLRKHETRLGKLAQRVQQALATHEEAKAAHAAAKKKVPKGKPYSREALEAHKAELAKIKAKGKLDAAKVAHAVAKKDHAAAKKEHTRTAKALEKMKHEGPSRIRTGGPGSPAKSGQASRSVAPETSGPAAPAVDQEPSDGGVPAHPAVAARVPVTVAEATRRIDRYATFFQKKGQEEQARWMELFRDHVQAVGTDAALQSLGEEIATDSGPREEVQYQGAHEEMSQFADHYLRRHGITPLIGSAAPTEAAQRFVSSWTPAEEPVPEGRRSGAGDFKPRDPTITNKLEEAKHLPGLESSEDIESLMGKPVTHLDAAVSARMDEQYGKGQWIIKAYGEDAFAGFGIFFPQRITQLTKDAQDTIWSAGERLASYGLSLRREDGKVVGLEHQDGRRFDFGSADYQQHIYGDARHLGDKVAEVADNEHGVALRDREGHINGKHWMAQPAFPVVGVSEAERAQGVTIKKGSEGRVHLVTRDGNVEIVPHATWLKEEYLPVVFENEDTLAMAEAARKAIAALPASERQGQVYAPDVVKTTQGFRVIEANPEAKGGGSGYLEDNPFIIDSYISHLVGREPAHVTFLRNLLTYSRHTKRSGQ